MKLYTDVPAVTRRGKHYDPAHILYFVCHCKYRMPDDAFVTYYGGFDESPEVTSYARFSLSWMTKMYLATSHLPKSLFRSLWIRFVYVETLYSVIIFRKEDDGGYTLWAKIEQASLDSYYNEVLPF